MLTCRPGGQAFKSLLQQGFFYKLRSGQPSLKKVPGNVEETKATGMLLTTSPSSVNSYIKIWGKGGSGSIIYLICLRVWERGSLIGCVLILLFSIRNAFKWSKKHTTRPIMSQSSHMLKSDLTYMLMYSVLPGNPVEDQVSNSGKKAGWNSRWGQEKIIFPSPLWQGWALFPTERCWRICGILGQKVHRKPQY